MKLPRLRSSVRKGFTLIELLTVIAIIGLLAGMLSVVVPMVKEKAARLDALNNCKQILTSYTAYSGGGSSAKNIPMEKTGSVTKWAVYLTQKNTEMNNAKLWFIANDSRLDGIASMPQYVINTATNAEDPAFVAALPKSWAVVADAPRSADSSYPIIWTRGLKGTTWDKQDSPWKGKGGHIGFADGSVRWVDDTKGDDDKGIFTDYTSKQQTDSIDAALGKTAKRLEDK